MFGELVPKNMALSLARRQRGVGGHPAFSVHQDDASADRGAERYGEHQLLRLVGVEAVEELRSAPDPGRVGIGGAASWRLPGALEFSDSGT